MGNGWAMDRQWMGVGEGLDGRWMGDGWVADALWTGYGCLSDGLWMAVGCVMDRYDGLCIACHLAIERQTTNRCLSNPTFTVLQNFIVEQDALLGSKTLYLSLCYFL